MQTQRATDPDRRLRIQLRKQIEWGRWAILAIFLVSLVNQVMLWFGSGYHFLFSAAMPYYVNWLASQLGGTGLKVVATLLTLLLFGAYAICVVFSGNRRDWMSATIGLYAVDTLVLCVFAFTMLENPASCILEILVHVALIAPMVNAIRAFDRMERLPKLRHRQDNYV